MDHLTIHHLSPHTGTQTPICTHMQRKYGVPRPKKGIKPEERKTTPFKSVTYPNQPAAGPFYPLISQFFRTQNHFDLCFPLIFHTNIP